MKQPIRELAVDAEFLLEDDVTDDRYKLQDRKRAIAQELFSITAGKRLQKAKQAYFEAKDDCLEQVNTNGNDHDRRAYNEVLAQEYLFLDSTNLLKIEAKTEELEMIAFQVQKRTPAYLLGWFNHLAENPQRFNDYSQAKSLIEAGKMAIASENWDRLSEIIYGLYNLLPETEQAQVREWTFTGIGS